MNKTPQRYSPWCMLPTHWAIKTHVDPLPSQIQWFRWFYRRCVWVLLDQRGGPDEHLYARYVGYKKTWSIGPACAGKGSRMCSARVRIKSYGASAPQSYAPVLYCNGHRLLRRASHRTWIVARTGWARTTRLPHLKARVFFLHLQNATLFGSFQRLFILDPSADSVFIEYITRSGAIWLKLTTRIISLWTNA